MSAFSMRRFALHQDIIFIFADVSFWILKNRLVIAWIIPSVVVRYKYIPKCHIIEIPS